MKLEFIIINNCILEGWKEADTVERIEDNPDQE